MRKRAALFLMMLSAFAVVSMCGCGKEAKEETVEKNTIFVTGAEAKEGEEITVYVRATDEIPVAAYGFEISYNPEELTFKECDRTEEYKKAWNGLELSNDTEGDDGRTVMIAGVNVNEAECKYKGDLYYITFTAAGKKGTEAELSLKVSALEDSEQADHMDEFTFKNGKIKIK